MLNFTLRNRWLILSVLFGIAAAGIYTMLHLNIEAYPDLTNKQVVVTTEWAGLSPVEVEQLITFPLETSMLGMPRTQTVRSISKLGLSMIAVLSNYSMDIH